MDDLDHGCTGNMNVIILASMDDFDHGCTGNMNVIILASMDALDHGCSRDMNKKHCRASRYYELQTKEPLPSINTC